MVTPSASTSNTINNVMRTISTVVVGSTLDVSSLSVVPPLTLLLLDECDVTTLVEVVVVVDGADGVVGGGVRS